MQSHEPGIDLEKVESASSRAQRLDFPRTRITNVMEAFLNVVGAAVGWLWVALVLVIILAIAIRYLIGGNTVWIEETQWHMFAVGYMLGIGYAIVHDSHVRVDVLASRFRPRPRAWIELLTIVLIIYPLCYLIIDYGMPFVENSFRRNERSSQPGGLANRWAIKAVILVAFGLIAFAATARLLRVCAFLFGFPRPLPHRS